jgi:exopolyphosphatase/guanosine-5'-triphosphate,3'-diphosphate pyrophosphatase
MSSERRPSIAGGLLTLEAAFAVLGLERMAVSKAALREGALYDMLGRGGADDPRDASIAALMERYGVDVAQATRVEETALHLFDEVQEAWSLTDDDRRMLARAARVHELGLAIAHSQYHVHGAYVWRTRTSPVSRSRNSACSPRSCARIGATSQDRIRAIPDRLLTGAKRIAALLRIAVLLHRSHEADDIPASTRAPVATRSC